MDLITPLNLLADVCCTTEEEQRTRFANILRIFWLIGWIIETGISLLEAEGP